VVEPPVIHLEQDRPERLRDIERLVAEAEAHDGFSALNEAALLHLHHPRPEVLHLTAEVSGAVAGYAQLEEGAPRTTGQLVVAVPWRRRGMGAALLDRMLAVAATPVQLWAMGDTPAAQGLAGKAGLRPGRELVIMTRPLTGDLPAAPSADGLTIRPFRVGEDETEWLRVNARAFAAHPEQGRLARPDLDERMAEPWFDPAGFLVAERNGRMIGFHWTKQHPDRLGEVYVLGVDPTAGGRGVGRALLLAGLRHLESRGNVAVELYVEADHERAVRLYRSAGFTPTGHDVLYVSAS
jgi:mycothiol synthase